ncbi:MAG: cytidine deaminase [Planctomycetales bacterium]
MNRLGLSDHDRRLLKQAEQAASHAYAPYSRFRVGAAVQGRLAIYCGANVENASFGLSLCAERVALATAIANGDRELSAVALVCLDGDVASGLGAFMPCGACRQWLAELAPGAVLLVGYGDQVERFSVAQLLPDPFAISP